MIEPPVVARVGMGIRVVFPQQGVGCTFERLREASEGPRAEVEVAHLTPAGIPNGTLHRIGVGLIQPRTRQDLIKTLDVRAPGTDWEKVLDTACLAVLAEWRRGAPITRVGLIPRRERPPDIVQHLLPALHTSCLFGPGSHGKGWIAIGMAIAVTAGVPFCGLAVQPGPVLYCDWEADEDTFRERVEAICRGLDVPCDYETLPLFYRHCQRPLPDEVETLSRQAAEINAVATVIDSVEMAQGGGEHRTHNDRATDMGRALRLIPGAHLLIDHISAENTRGKDLAGKPINGIMKVNLARNMWELRREQETGEAEALIALYHAKVNNGALQPAKGFRVTWRPDGAVVIRPGDPRTAASLAQRLPARDQIEAHLSQVRQATEQEIAKALEMSPKTVNSALAAWEGKRFVRLVVGQRGGAAAVWGRLHAE